MAPSTGVTGCCPGGCSGATQPSGAVLLHGPKYPQDSGTGVTSSWLGVPRQEAGPNPTPGVVFLALSPPHLQTPSSCPGNTRTSAKPQQDGDGGRTGGSGPAAQRGCGGRGAGGARCWHRTGLVPGPAAAWSGRAQRAARGLPRAGCAPPAGPGSGISISGEEGSLGCSPRSCFSHTSFILILFFLCACCFYSSKIAGFDSGLPCQRPGLRLHQSRPNAPGVTAATRGSAGQAPAWGGGTTAAGTPPALQMGCGTGARGVSGSLRGAASASPSAPGFWGARGHGARTPAGGGCRAARCGGGAPGLLGGGGISALWARGAAWRAA